MATLIEAHPRYQYYAGTPLDGKQPQSVKPTEHTMKRQAFFKYIGVSPDGSIGGKKFSTQQAAALEAAIRDNRTIRVIGAPREDIDLVIQIHRRAPVSELLLHDRPDGRHSNVHRQAMCLTENASGESKVELWVFVFPSKQYVDQISEIIQALVDWHAKTTRLKPHQRSQRVHVVHFERLESEVATWTGFHDTAKRYVRFGDVAVIGNLDRMLPGLLAAGFAEPEGWQAFGLSGMFLVSRLTDPFAKKQILLFGFNECFWGEASGHYCRALIRCGVQHVLYGSKAGNLASEDHLSEIMAPNAFCTLSSERRVISINRLSLNESHVVDMMRLCNIKDSGVAVTVSTVIGEDEYERKSYESWSPAVIDCENWHIAKVIQDHNDAVSREFPIPHQNLSVRFVPVHFITDYIFSKKERVRGGTANLADAEGPRSYKNDRGDQFRKIGFFFGVYAHRFGVRENLSIRLDGFRATARSETTTREAADIGYGTARLRIEFLLHNYSARSLPIDDLVTLAKISQYAGYSTLFFRVYDIVERNRRAISDSDIMLFDILRLKLLLQRGDWLGAIDSVKAIEGNADGGRLLIECGQSGAFVRRKALIGAYLSKASIDINVKHAAESAGRSRYEVAAFELFREVASLHAVDGVSLRSMTERLAAIRAKCYSTAETATQGDQSRNEKSAVALLFLEAAAYLKWGRRNERDRVMKLLYVAHILNVRLGGNESSELNGEILSAVTEPGHRTLLAIAMQRDDDGAILMRTLVANNEWAQDIGTESMASFGLRPMERGERVSRLIEQ